MTRVEPPSNSQQDDEFDVARVLGSTLGTFHTAELALNDLLTQEDPVRQLAAIRQIAIAGRGVTFMLQKLRSLLPDFDKWYQPIQGEMKQDPLLRYFHELRNHIEKEGLPRPIYADLRMLEDGRVVAEAAIALGEDIHGIWVSGALHDPAMSAAVSAATKHVVHNVRLPKPPSHHSGAPIGDDRFASLARLYLDYLWSRLIEPARERFDS